MENILWNIYNRYTFLLCLTVFYSCCFDQSQCKATVGEYFASSIYEQIWGKALKNSNLIRNSDHSKLTRKLEKNAKSFSDDVENWITDVLEMYDSAKFNTSFHFAIERDPQLNHHQCTDFIFNQYFAVLKSIFEVPKDPLSGIRRGSDVIWQPSLKCLQDYDYSHVDGGATAGFEVLCNSETLLRAGIKSGSVFNAEFDEENSTFFSGGSSMGVEMLNNTITLGGGVSGFSTLGSMFMKYSTDPNNALEILRYKIRKCVTSKNFLIRGGGGAGWHSSYIHERSFKNSSIGYSFVFESRVILDISIKIQKKAASEAFLEALSIDDLQMYDQPYDESHYLFFYPLSTAAISMASYYYKIAATCNHESKNLEIPCFIDTDMKLSPSKGVLSVTKSIPFHYGKMKNRVNYKPKKSTSNLWNNIFLLLLFFFGIVMVLLYKKIRYQGYIPYYNRNKV